MRYYLQNLIELLYITFILSVAIESLKERTCDINHEKV
jgi:hypothetical protein